MIQASTQWRYDIKHEFYTAMATVRKVNDDIVEICLIRKDGAVFSILMGKADWQVLSQTLHDQTQGAGHTLQGADDAPDTAHP
jgi:lipoprotein signal peptidase